ncbi:hypothetical protein C8R43DRAFT_953621 [Mycena crocata]|nr:hypothetical protein C8R43DRAFT_953621 [Mycena crocata]
MNPKFFGCQVWDGARKGQRNSRDNGETYQVVSNRISPRIAPEFAAGAISIIRRDAASAMGFWTPVFGKCVQTHLPGLRRPCGLDTRQMGPPKSRLALGRFSEEWRQRERKERKRKMTIRSKVLAFLIRLDGRNECDLTTPTFCRSFSHQQVQRWKSGVAAALAECLTAHGRPFAKCFGLFRASFSVCTISTTHQVRSPPGSTPLNSSLLLANIDISGFYLDEPRSGGLPRRTTPTIRSFAWREVDQFQLAGILMNLQLEPDVLVHSRPFELRESWAAALVPRYRPYFRLYHHHPRQSSLPFFPLKMRKHHISSSAERPKNSEKMPPGTCLQVEWDVKKSHWQANEHQLKVQYGMSTRKAAYFALSPAHAAPTSITICIAFPRAAFSFGEQAAGRKLRREVTTGSLFYHLPSNQNTIFDRPASKIFHLCTKIRFFEVPRKRSKFSPSGKHDFPPVTATFELEFILTGVIRNFSAMPSNQHSIVGSPASKIFNYQVQFKVSVPSSWNLSSQR